MGVCTSIILTRSRKKREPAGSAAGNRPLHGPRIHPSFIRRNPHAEIADGGGGRVSPQTTSTSTSARQDTFIREQLGKQKELEGLKTKLAVATNYKGTPTSTGPMLIQTRYAVSDPQYQKDQERVQTLTSELAKTPSIAQLYKDQTALEQKQSELRDAKAELKKATDARDNAFPNGRPSATVDTTTVASTYGSAYAAKGVYDYDQLNSQVTSAQSKVSGLTTDVQSLTGTVQSSRQSALSAAGLTQTTSTSATSSANAAEHAQELTTEATSSANAAEHAQQLKDGWQHTLKDHEQTGTKAFEAGSVHEVKKGDTLWHISHCALRAQGVAHPTDAQIAAAVNVIADNSRTDASKRTQFSDVKSRRTSGLARTRTSSTRARRSSSRTSPRSSTRASSSSGTPSASPSRKWRPRKTRRSSR